MTRRYYVVGLPVPLSRIEPDHLQEFLEQWGAMLRLVQLTEQFAVFEVRS